MLRVNFLANVVKTGLEIELEQGVRAKNKHLIFVKIHAPDHVIVDYGDFFNIRRFFKDNHADFINPNSWYLDLLPFTIGRKRERELVKFVRKQNQGPLNYSNIERSTIVYKILLMLPFGLYENYVGLDRLLRHRIILDVFPLHDGPYFYVPDQDPTKINGRQILCRTWLDFSKLLTCRQPYSLVHDYMGERVAFYFAFLNYYIKALFIASIISIVFFVMSYKSEDTYNIRKLTCGSTESVCGACAVHTWCPTRKLSEYCDKTKVIHVTYSIPNACFCVLMGLLSTLFIPLWERRTCYLNWLWEINQFYAKRAVRPEYIIPDNLPWRKNYVRQVILTIYNLFIYVIYVAIIVSIMLLVMYYKHAILYMTYGTDPYINFYYVLAGLAAFNFFFAVLMQYVNKILCFVLTNVENHRTYAAHESSYIWKLFIFNALCHTFMILFSAYFVVFGHWGREAGYTPTLISDIKYMNCGPYGCGDELTVIVVVIVFMNEVLTKFPWKMLPIQTDYQVVKAGNSRVPVWEREYELCKINEDSLDKMYLDLMIQMVLGFFFLQAFPLSPVLLLFSNLWNLCYYPHHMVKGCRRPLVRNSTGITAWQQVIIAIGYAVPLFNILCVALSTDLVERKIYDIVQTTTFSLQYKYFKNTYNNYFLFVTSKNGACKYPLMFDKDIGVNRYWQPKRYKWWGILLTMHVTIVFALLARWLITRCPKDIKETVRTEKYITYRYYLAKGVTK
ncbi:PREDICTED: anoctamin-9-like isoform X2 [Papilio polytes]|nr:PREDICTED: anoctamin-9-like isoform X2 [Papilio polytes]